MSTSIPTVVLGGTGYVAGELLRLLSGHPVFRLCGVLSESQPGESVAEAFPHLASVWPQERFRSREELGAMLGEAPRAALFCAAPHGVSARMVDQLLVQGERHGTRFTVVDISADFRFASAQAYEAVYHHAHGAPARLAEFTCALPEQLDQLRTPHVAHPGCFATATLLASVPLLAAGLIAPMLYVSGITGSTGSGRKPVDGTHHPLRHSDLYSYSPLAHRHAPEIAACARAASGVAAEFAFVPHSGPFARGIHVTVQAALQSGADTARVLQALQDFYRDSPFVRISARSPRLKEVVTTNYAQLSAVATARSVAVMCAIDNLTKGAAGGAVQWMNRLFGLPEDAGLRMPAPGWT